MDKGNIKIWQLAGTAAVSLLGTLLHFLYDITESPVAALFSAVNESTWEHMKLLFFPMFLFAVIESFFMGRKYEGFWCVKLMGTLMGLVLIPVLFYTIGGIFGETPDFINISIFFVAVIAAFIYETGQFIKDAPCKAPKLAFAAFFLIAAAFFIFTFAAPEIPLFEDPIGGGYGI